MTRIAAARAAAAAGIVAALAGAAITSAHGQEKPKNERETKVRSDKARLESDARWIYDDLPRGIAEAKASGKPLLVVLRCIPCENCAQIDEDVIAGGSDLGRLLDRFVCVRVPHANGLDLSLFQFDLDQSWAAFLLNADLTIYGRYGTRSHRTDSARDVSLDGFAKALEGALALHAEYPANRDALAAKRGPASAVAVPEAYPSLKSFGPRLDYDGAVVKSCIHCHQVGEAQRRVLRDAAKAFPEELLFPFPNPAVVGLTLDPKERARVASVEPGSPSEKAGLRAGDDIVALEGQPILSIADVQWVLHRAGDKERLRARVARGDATREVELVLTPGWRRRGDLSWRATSWDLRRMVTGGILLEPLDEAARKAAGIAPSAMALRAKHVGEYGEHAAAKRAGFVKGDVLVAIAGRTDLVTETAVFEHLLATTKPGGKVPVVVLRDGRRLELTLPTQ